MNEKQRKIKYFNKQGWIIKNNGNNTYKIRIYHPSKIIDCPASLLKLEPLWVYYIAKFFGLRKDKYQEFNKHYIKAKEQWKKN